MFTKLTCKCPMFGTPLVLLPFTGTVHFVFSKLERSLTGTDCISSGMSPSTGISTILISFLGINGGIGVVGGFGVHVPASSGVGSAGGGGITKPNCFSTSAALNTTFSWGINGDPLLCVEILVVVMEACAVDALSAAVVGELPMIPWMMPTPGTPPGRVAVVVSGDPLYCAPPTGGGILVAVALGTMRICLFESVK